MRVITKVITAMHLKKQRDLNFKQKGQPYCRWRGYKTVLLERKQRSKQPGWQKRTDTKDTRKLIGYLDDHHELYMSIKTKYSCRNINVTNSFNTDHSSQRRLFFSYTDSKFKSNSSKLPTARMPKLHNNIWSPHFVWLRR